MGAQPRAPWVSQWNWAIQVISQAGLQHTFFYHGYWFEPREEWFFKQRRLDIDLHPFTLEQLGVSVIWLMIGLAVSAVVFFIEAIA